MNSLKFLFALICGLTYTQAQAQQPFFDKGFAIIHSTKDYNAALKTANEASEKLGLEVDLRSYYPDREEGLKSDEVCGCGLVHGYIPRGRWDDGVYLSIEYSNRYTGFSKGYYMVIVASGESGSQELTQAYQKARIHYTDAYIKNTSMYLGCMH